MRVHIHRAYSNILDTRNETDKIWTRRESHSEQLNDAYAFTGVMLRGVGDVRVSRGGEGRISKS